MKTHSQAMPSFAQGYGAAGQRTPNGACGKQSDIDGQPEGGLAGKPGIKAFAPTAATDVVRVCHPAAGCVAGFWTAPKAIRG